MVQFLQSQQVLGSASFECLSKNLEFCWLSYKKSVRQELAGFVETAYLSGEAIRD